MGKDEKKLLEMSRRQRKPPPARILNAPDLLPGLELYFEAFHRLTTSRALGQGAIGPIGYMAISAYCKDEGIEGEMRQDMFYHIEHLDMAYMEWQTKKAVSEQPRSE